MTSISIENLQKTFGSHQALRGINLEVKTGELLGLVGPNGAGKSTLLRTMIGLVAPDGGNISVLGHDPRTDSLSIRKNCSYLPGETGIYQQMTGDGFLRFALGFFPRQQEKLLDRLQTAFELPMHQKVRSYSAGMKQKLALMACLVPDVDLYVLDEPDRALDASIRFFLRDVLLAQKQAGKTIVLSSHHLSEVETLADRLEFLIEGQLIPRAKVDAARRQLARQPRLRLRDDTLDLPSGAVVVRREPDGTLIVEPEGNPMAWLNRLPPEQIESAEVGVVRLEDLYQLLIMDPAETLS